MEEVIEKVDDVTCRTLLRHKYINGETFEAIAEKMCYDVRHVYRLHKKAINLVEKRQFDKYK